MIIYNGWLFLVEVGTLSFLHCFDTVVIGRTSHLHNRLVLLFLKGSLWKCGGRKLRRNCQTQVDLESTWQNNGGGRGVQVSLYSTECDQWNGLDMFRVCMWLVTYESVACWQIVNTILKIKLRKDMHATLPDGVLLCHLANHLRFYCLSMIHVPFLAMVLTCHHCITDLLKWNVN